MASAPPPHLVVVGASLAGLRAVEAARKAGHPGAITLIGAEEQLPYDRPPLSKELLAPKPDRLDTTFRTREDLVGDLEDGGLGVRLLLGRPATGLDPDRRTVTVGDAEIGYDRLVIATGASPRLLPGLEDHPAVRPLRTVADAHAIRDALDRDDRILVVGCGFIGSEVASALVRRGRPVTLVELADVPLVRAVGELTGGYFADLHRRHGVDLRLGCKLETVVDGSRGLRVGLSDGSAMETDLVVLGLGAVPATRWLEGSGIALEADGSIAADARLRTSLPGVYAAGDVVTWENALVGRRMRLEHWTSAAEQGAVAARNALADPGLETYATVPYFWSDLHGVRIQFVGVHAEHLVVAEGPEEARVVCYAEDGVLVGALTVAQPRLTMKLRKIIAERGDLTAALRLVEAAGLSPAG